MSYKKLLGIAISSSALCLFTVSGALAQNSDTTDARTPLSQQALRELQDSRSLYSTGSNGLNVMQLIHNANLTGGKSTTEFSTEQSEALNDAAKEFRQQQRQKLGLPTSNVVTPSQTN